MKNTGSCRCKGSAYVFILTVSVLVTGIGLAALLAVRVERRSANLTEATVKARFAALSLMQVVLLRITEDPDWRTTYSHDVWEPKESADGVVYTFKLVDEQDGNLANDSSQSVRLYAKAMVGDAVRIYSVLLNEEGGASANLLVNADMEDGLTDWSAMRCTIKSSTSNPHSGTACLEMTEGEASGSGPQQYLSGVENGVAYDLEVWARKASGASYVRIAFAITSSGEGKVFFEDLNDDTYVDTAWTKCTTTLTPTWSGTLEEARVKFTVPSGTYDMFVDDAAMRVAGSGPSISVVPGTCRREVLP